MEIASNAASDLAAALMQQHQQWSDQDALRSLKVYDQAGKWVRLHHETSGENPSPPMLNLASNDYLGLSHHPTLKQAAINAIETFGTGATASPLIVGYQSIHDQAAQAFTDFKHPPRETQHTWRSILTTSGYAANLAVLTTLPEPHDLICLDKLNHASLIDAARFAQTKASSHAIDVRTYPHLAAGNDDRRGIDKLRRLLEQHCTTADASARRYIVTDSVFSMDGDVADLPALCDLADEYQAILIVDEAHGTGVLGPRGAGLCEAQGVSDRVPITISTASKALASQGGIITASPEVIERLINRARSYIYSTGLAPVHAATLLAAIQLIQAEPQRIQHLRDLCQHARQHLTDQGWQLPITPEPTPILPLICGSNDNATQLAQQLQNQNILGVPIRPPTVPPNAARVRLTLRADLTTDESNAMLTKLPHHHETEPGRPRPDSREA